MFGFPSAMFAHLAAAVSRLTRRAVPYAACERSILSSSTMFGFPSVMFAHLAAAVSRLTRRAVPYAECESSILSS
ncbi:hypothetical protein LRE49_16515, partial [Sulfitobacter pseudonitzschiae]|nr:hypothetical protein [Pseudosulfitobacter pseudonitzschiae]